MFFYITIIHPAWWVRVRSGQDFRSIEGDKAQLSGENSSHKNGLLLRTIRFTESWAQKTDFWIEWMNVQDFCPFRWVLKDLRQLLLQQSITRALKNPHPAFLHSCFLIRCPLSGRQRWHVAKKDKAPPHQI
jgi:hypothetical protein